MDHKQPEAMEMTNIQRAQHQSGEVQQKSDILNTFFVVTSNLSPFE